MKAMKKIKRLVAVTGTYTDRNGREKRRYMTVGSLFQRDDGSFCVNLEALPLGEFNGWLNAYDLEEDRQEHAKGGIVEAQKAAQKESVPMGNDLNDDDIPF